MSRAFTLKKYERLSQPLAIRRLLSGGKQIEQEGFKIYFQRNETPSLRLCVLVSKRDFRKASSRNRWRRLVREFFRLNKNRMSSCYDIAVRVQKGRMAEGVRYPEIAALLASLLEKGGLIQSSR